MNLKSLPLKNLKRRSARTFFTGLIIALLSFTMTAGVLVLLSLQKGLASLETRLGADIIVVPDEAKSKKDLESILLDGVPGYFYMDRSYLDRIAAVDGIEKLSVQYYLASAKAGCCSLPIQIIGYDPNTDFTITPWISDSTNLIPGTNEIVVGYDVNATVGSTLKFFGVSSKVVGKLDRTGSALDTAVYANYETIKLMIEGSKSNSFPYFSNHDPDDIISSILIDVKDGCSIDDVAGYINVHVRGVEAVATKSMLSKVSDSLSGVSSVISFLILAIFILVTAVLIMVFATGINERKKEFAVLRVIGTSRKMLSGIIFREAFILSAAGGGAGVLLALVTVFTLEGTVEEKLNLPFLTPGIIVTIIISAVSLLLTILLSAISSSYSAYRLSSVDVGKILRE